MEYKTFIPAESLAKNIHDKNWAVFDCRFSLIDVNYGRSVYQDSHISGAVYADIESDLSGPVTPGITGRHPLPDIDFIVEKFSEWGISKDVQVVVYDDVSGTYAARLWWLLRLLGHSAVAVLDGGWQKWVSAGFPIQSGIETRHPKKFVPRLTSNFLLITQDVVENLEGKKYLLLDVRDSDRYQGVREPIDPIAGHIPGAISLPYKDALNQDGTIKSPSVLLRYFQQKIKDIPHNQLATYCGSGVTAAFGVLILEYAGFDTPLLYAGSWSEWITDPSRPIIQGENP
jgi:thiosulfate/3-mercaptopyruvate sulfurtransferase